MYCPFTDCIQPFPFALNKPAVELGANIIVAVTMSMLTRLQVNATLLVCPA